MIFNPKNVASDFYSAIINVPGGGNYTDKKQKPTLYIGIRISGAANGLGLELNGYNQSSVVSSFGWGVANNETQIIYGNFGDVIFHNGGAGNVNVQILRAFLM